MKNLYIPQEQRGDPSPWRRFEQATLSFAYEQRHSKDEILTAYLNTVYFGDGAYGAEEAARKYFGKDASDLSLSEAAALAGFLHAPSTYLSGSGEGVELATQRRNEVLERMEEQGMISAGELSEAEDTPLEFAPDPTAPEDPNYKPFMEAVRREVESKLGPGAIEHGWLQIQTTLNPDLQRNAVSSVSKTLSHSDDPSGAVASVEPQTGAVRALAGQKDDFNLALDARRQPGSSFKPFVLSTALKEFVSPESATYVSHNPNVDYEGGEKYQVQNYDGIERGRISLSEAMAESDNTVYVQLAPDLG